MIFTKPSHSKWKVLHFAQKPRIFLFCVDLIFVQFHKCLGGQIPFSFSLSCSKRYEAVLFISHNPLVSSPFLSAREPRVGGEPPQAKSATVQYKFIPYAAKQFSSLRIPNSSLRLPMVAGIVSLCFYFSLYLSNFFRKR